MSREGLEVASIRGLAVLARTPVHMTRVGPAAIQINQPASARASPPLLAGSSSVVMHLPNTQMLEQLSKNCGTLRIQHGWRPREA